MPFLKIQDFDKHMAANKISPVYLFAGEEFYLIDRCLAGAERALNADDLNKEVFHAGESSADDILNALQTLPFLSDRRIVVIKETHKLKAADAEILSGYVSNPVETSSLIMLYPGNYKKESVLKRKELISKCSSLKSCIAVDCRRQYESEVKEFIKSEFAKRGKSVSFDAITRIVEDNGTDLLNISNEIEKLSLFAGKNKKNVTEEDIEKISGYTKEVNIYSLSSELEAKNVKKAMFVLEKLLAEGEEEVMVLSAMSSAVRKLLNAKSMLEEQEMPADEIASALRIHNYYAKAFFANLKKHSFKNLKDSMKIMLKADTAIKTGTSDAVSALEKAVLAICK